MAMPFLFAFQDPVEPPRRAWLNIELFLWGTLLMVLLAAGTIIAWKLRAWVVADEREPTPEHSLEHYQELLEQGLIDPAEFERIRARFGDPPAPPPPTDP
jgi:hypothetical protein